MVRFWQGRSFKIEDSSPLAVCSHDLSLAYVYVCVCRERERERITNLVKLDPYTCGFI